ncbi:MAG: hypothetical protein MZV49_24085 [Rhodopseudomonas palustris]|nr:hypothetical protein [Rhodopseudomonas palustris]
MNQILKEIERMTTNDLETINKAVVRTINEGERRERSQSPRLHDRRKGPGRRHRYGSVITGVIVKKNRARATVKAKDELGTTMWTVPYSMLSVAGAKNDALNDPKERIEKKCPGCQVLGQGPRHRHRDEEERVHGQTDRPG